MSLPKAISTWSMIPFFPFTFLNHVIRGITFLPILTALTEVGAAAFLFLERWPEDRSGYAPAKEPVGLVE